MSSHTKRKQAFQRLDAKFFSFLALSIVFCLCTIRINSWALLRLSAQTRNQNGSLGINDHNNGTLKISNPQPLTERIAHTNVTREEAIAKYRKTFETWRRQYPVCMTRAPMNVSSAIECGIRAHGRQPLQYPVDAEEHFAEIHLKMAEWGQHDAHIMHTAANYSGPWIENYWIEHFLSKALTRPCLHEAFGIYVPLFIPWVDLWVENKFRYPDGFIDSLITSLRPDVAYVTVSQGDMGISGYRELPMKKIPNVLVLSAGGYGHVPIPLLKQEENSRDGETVEPSKRPNTFVYTGSLEHSPKNLRKKMHSALLASEFDYTHYYGSDWRSMMQSALFNLVPRGYGRSAYHLIETLQSNLVPIYVYSDEPWIPYQEVFDSIGYKATFEELPELMKRLSLLPRSAILRMEQQIALLRSSHFSYAGAMHQIGLFLKHNSVSDLRCQRLPKSPR